jgi:hypothetical protein
VFAHQCLLISVCSSRSSSFFPAARIYSISFSEEQNWRTVFPHRSGKTEREAQSSAAHETLACLLGSNWNDHQQQANGSGFKPS